MLRYLEAEALGQAAPDYAVHLLGDLLHAAEALGLRSLQVQSLCLLPMQCSPSAHVSLQRLCQCVT